MNGIDSGLLIAIFLAMIGTNAGIAVLWRKLGNVETGLGHVRKEQIKVATALEETNKKSCPFPSCPVFKRAIDEAAPKRDMSEV